MLRDSYLLHGIGDIVIVIYQQNQSHRIIFLVHIKPHLKVLGIFMLEAISTGSVICPGIFRSSAG